MSLARAQDIDDELRALWERALSDLRDTRGGNELLAEVLPASVDPLGELVAAGQVYVERREDVTVGLAVVRDAVIVGVYVAPAWRGQGCRAFHRDASSSRSANRRSTPWPYPATGRPSRSTSRSG